MKGVVSEESQSTTFRRRQTWAPYPSPPPWLCGPGQAAGVNLQNPLKRAIILPHRMVLELNEINSTCEALGTVTSRLSVLSKCCLSELCQQLAILWPGGWSLLLEPLL